MSATASAPPSAVEAQGMSRREGQGSSRRDSQSYTNPSRTQSTRSRPSATVPSPVRAHSSNSRPTSRRVDEILPQQDYETTNVAQSSRKRSTDHSNHIRTESTRSGHTRSSSRHHPTSDMTSAAGNSSAAGPAPVVVPVEQKATRQGRSRTVIPAQTGNWILGKTIGSGSMGKVKLARRVEGQEEVSETIAHDIVTRLLTVCCRLLSRSFPADPPPMNPNSRPELIVSVRSVPKRYALLEKPQL